MGEAKSGFYKMLFKVLLLLLSIRLSTCQSQIEEFSNWTTCLEFVNNTDFKPESVIDVDWKIFYFWNPEVEETYNIQFRRPTATLIQRFKVELDEELKPPVNWNATELFMESSIDFSALYVRTPTPGIYRVIPSTAFDYKSVPLLIFALKVVEPGYLGIENCKHRIGYALAPADKMPFHYELEKAAQTLKFYNNYNRSHISLPKRPFETPYLPHDGPDDDLDDDMDVEVDHDRMEFF